MKKFTKIFALAVSSVLSLSLLAGCGDKNINDDPSSTLPEFPAPDKTVTGFTDQDATLKLDGTVSESWSISDSLFGVFLEDINYAGYLLDDNLIPNGSFESFSGKAANWTAKSASLAVENTDGVLKGQAEYAAKGVNANYAAVRVTSAGGGLTSAGHPYLPIAVQNDAEYTFSAFVKSAAAAEMTVSLKKGSETLAEKVISVKGNGEWVKYQTVLKPNATADSGVTFAITFGAEGTYYLDGIQLETSLSKDGIKQYVYDAVKELAPKFVRFPGGCIIEGDSAAGGADTTEVYDWKNSIGAVQSGTEAGDDIIPQFSYTLVKDGVETSETTQGEWITRRQNGDLWGYDLEYGVGFLEFFKLCENLGASAVPVLNCGMSDQGGAAQGTKGIELNGRHGKKVEDYIQDAIDLIEFAKGDKTTKWGGIRAALGHEAPFEMDYLGIGNEQSGEYYTKYYEKFLQSKKFTDALAQYSVKPIVGNGMFMGDCRDTTQVGGADRTDKGTAQKAAEAALAGNVISKISDYGVHDQHYYVNWTKLLECYAMYDKYARSSQDGFYGVFVGEYSANEGTSSYPEHQNQLITALAEAAMMTSYEHNGNVVELAAYAPMFGVADTAAGARVGGNDEANQWDVDMMYFTNTEIVRTANYYVQKMFMNNMGASYLYKSKLQWSGEEKFTFPPTAGAAKEFNKLYWVSSKDANGDLIVKVVNVSGGEVKVNVDISNATGRGFAYVTELSNSDFKVLNTLNNKTAVSPVSSSIGWTGQSFGYAFKPYSLTVLRIPTAE